MSIPGESRESLDLLASAAEQSSPQSRIKRNTACVSCRDSKVKCNASAVPGQPCQRCAKLKLTCVVDRSHKRVSKRSKFEELVQEVQSIKQAVAPRASSAQLPLPSLPPPTASASAFANDGLRLYPTAPFSAAATPISSITSFSAPAPPNRPVHQSSPNNGSHSLPSVGQQMPTPSASTSSGRPSQPRALKSRVFAGHDIDVYFDKYFESFHPYLPIVRIREPDAIYQAGPVLFWVIMVTACRRVPDAAYVFEFLVESIKSEVWEAVYVPFFIVLVVVVVCLDLPCPSRSDITLLTLSNQIGPTAHVGNHQCSAHPECMAAAHHTLHERSFEHLYIHVDEQLLPAGDPDWTRRYSFDALSCISSWGLR